MYDTDAVIEAAETTLGMSSVSLTALVDRLTVATPLARADGSASGRSSDGSSVS